MHQALANEYAWHVWNPPHAVAAHVANKQGTNCGSKCEWARTAALYLAEPLHEFVDDVEHEAVEHGVEHVQVANKQEEVVALLAEHVCVPTVNALYSRAASARAEGSNLQKPNTHKRGTKEPRESRHGANIRVQK